MPHDDDKSLWKKELSFKRTRKEDAPPVEPAAVEPSEPELELPAELVAALEPPPPPALDVPEPPAFEHDWLTQPLDEVSEPPASEPPVADPPVAEPPAAAPPTERPPLHALPEPEPLPAPPPAASLPPVAPPGYDDLFDLDLGELDLDEPTAVAEAPAPRAAPEPTAETASVPFYKRELSFGRKGPKPAKAEKQPKEPKERRRKPAKPERTEAKVPFYKRELSLGRGGKTAPAPAQPAAEPAPKPAKASRSLPSLRLPALTLPTRGGTTTAKKLVGLKIGSSQLAAARIQNGSVPELVQAVREPLEPGIVVGGELRDPEALALALKAFFKQHGLPRRGVRLGIANNRIGVRTFDVAGIHDAKQLDNAIKFRAQEVLPIPIEEAVLDYQILSESTNADGEPVRRVLLVVAYRELVDRYLAACRKAGIQIVGIDLEAFALLRAIAEPRALLAPGQTDERGALVAVSVGHERSTFAVSDGRVCDFTRVLEWGGWAMNVAIARALDTAPSEAEPIKRALSFAGGGELPAGVTEEQLETAREAARKQLQSFARELVSSLQFYQNQPGSLGIGEIVVTGGTTHLPGFGAELERLIGVPVRVGDPLARVKVSKKVRERDQLGSLAVAIGLGIED